MKTLVGLTVLNKNLARGKSPVAAVAIGTGGADPGTGISVAPSINDTGLKNQIYFTETIDVVSEIEPPQTDTPRVEVRNTFYARNVVPSGIAVTAINEFGVFAKDPDTGLFVLIDRVTFDNEPFSVPASGRSVSRDAIQITLDLGLQ